MVIAEFTASATHPDAVEPGSERRVLELEGHMISANGAGIAFGPDGYLYISIGDDAFGDSSYVYRAQDLAYLNRKLLRIDINKTPYAIPPDNPFVGMKRARPEIWAYGFRKMWRFSLDPASQQLFGADVGELKSEEINIIKKGGDYGWPYMEGNSILHRLPPVVKRRLSGPSMLIAIKTESALLAGKCILAKTFLFYRRNMFSAISMATCSHW